MTILRGHRRWTTAALVVLGGVVAMLLTPVGPGAAQAPDGAPEAALTISGLTRVLGPGTEPPADDPRDRGQHEDTLAVRVLVENTGEVPLSAAQLTVEIHPPALTRGVLADALDGDIATSAMHVHTRPLRTSRRLAPGEIAGLEASFEEDEVAWAADAGGVHPVRIAVTVGTEVIAEVVTAVVWLGEYPTEPMLTSVVWPLDGPPWRSAGGAYPPQADREIRPGGRLETLVSAIQHRPNNVPVVPAPAAHLLEDLSDRADGFTALEPTDHGDVARSTVTATDRRAVEADRLLRRMRELATLLARDPVTGPYAGADLAGLLAGGPTHRELAAVAASEGRRRVEQQLGREADGATQLVGAPITPAVLDVLHGEVVVVPPEAADLPRLGADPELGEPVRDLPAPSGRRLTALIGDPYLRDAFGAADEPGGPVVAAQRVLASTAMAYLTEPSRADRGLILLPDADWSPPAGAAAQILHALGDAVWLEHVTPARLARSAERAATPLSLSEPEHGAFAQPFAGELTDAWHGLAAAAEAVPAETTRFLERPVQQLRDDLLRASSSWFRDGGEAEAAAIVRDVQRAIDDAVGDVEVSEGSVTLTAETGEIPITINRIAGGPMSVVVTVESQGRLLWPGGRTSEVLLLEEEGSQTVSFETRAVSTGTFPVTVMVTDPSGTHELDRRTLTVRSTTISGPALTATAAVVVVLLLLGALRRRPNQRRLELVSDTADTTGRDDD